MKKPKKEKPIPVNIKVPKDEWLKIWANAKKYADFNLSGWLREAGMNYKPRKKK